MYDLNRDGSIGISDKGIVKNAFGLRVATSPRRERLERRSVAVHALQNSPGIHWEVFGFLAITTMLYGYRIAVAEFGLSRRQPFIAGTQCDYSQHT